MSLESHRIQAEGTLKAFMTANYPQIPIQYEEVPFVQPDGPFVAIFLAEGESFRANLGAGYRVVFPGFVQVDFVQPTNRGKTVPNTIIEQIGQLFEEKDLVLNDGARLLYRTPSYSPGPTLPGWYRRMLRVDFERHETR